MLLKISDLGKYVQSGLMKLQGREVVCHSVGEVCKKTRISGMDVVDGARILYAQHIDTPVDIEYQDEALVFTEQKERKLSEKEAAQLVWHSFRFSNGNAVLQFTMLYFAWKKYGKQDLDIEDVYNVFLSLLNIGAMHIVREQVQNNERIPPHPKIIVHLREVNIDIGLSTMHNHKKINSEYIEEGIEPVKMLLTGSGYLKDSDRDGTHYKTRLKEYEQKGKNIEAIFERDFKYLLNQKTEYNQDGYTKIFTGRPNRKPEHDGENNMKDRFFSYFVWYIVGIHKTGNDIFDEYFAQLHEHFSKWFAGLSTDRELEIWNKTENERKKVNGWNHTFVSPIRKSSSRYFTKITKDDVLLLIAQYNATHPDTQVSMNELGLSEKPNKNGFPFSEDFK